MQSAPVTATAPNAAGGLQFERIFAAMPLSIAEGRAALVSRCALARTMTYVSGHDHKAADGTSILNAGTEIGMNRVADYTSGRIGRFFAAPAALKTEIYSAAMVHALYRAEVMVAAAATPDFGPMVHSARNLVESIADDCKAFPLVIRVSDSIRCENDVVRKHYVTALRKALLAVLMARAAALPERQIVDLCLAAALGGIGMAFMDPAMMAKEHLIEEELEKIRSYPVFGYRVLAASCQLSPAVLRAVHDHQKLLDDSGYPDDGYAPDAAAQIVGIATAFAAMLWRNTPAGNAVQVLTRPEEGVAAKYDRRLLDALQTLWDDSGYRDASDRVLPRDVIAGSRAYDCVIYEHLAGLVFFIEHVLEGLRLLQQVIGRLQLLVRGIRQNRKDVEKFLATLVRVENASHLMGLKPGMDIETLFQDPAALRETEEQAYALYMEMYRHARDADRVAMPLRQAVTDRSFHDVLKVYESAIKELFRAGRLIQQRSRTPV